LATVVERHDVEFAREYLRRFYWTARHYGREVAFDPVQAADLELAYWVAHRDLSGRAESEKGPLEESLTRLHAALCDLPLERVRESGVARARGGRGGRDYQPSQPGPRARLGARGAPPSGVLWQYCQGLAAK
jgi:hypothetical protein